jgi:hypothetical protein
MLSLRNGSPVTGRKASGCRCAECCKWFRRARYPLALMEPIAETPPTTVLATESLQSATPLPAPPPAPVPADAPKSAAQAGQLTAGWSTVFWIGWMLIAASFAAIWYSSRLVGLSTWWLGPATEPQLILVNLLPFTVPLALCVAGFRAQRRLPWWGIGGAAFVAAIAFFDIDRVPGYAAIEFGLAAAGLLISVASFAGLFRNP